MTKWVGETFAPWRTTACLLVGERKQLDQPRTWWNMWNVPSQQPQSPLSFLSVVSPGPSRIVASKVVGSTCRWLPSRTCDAVSERVFANSTTSCVISTSFVGSSWFSHNSCFGSQRPSSAFTARAAGLLRQIVPGLVPQYRPIGERRLWGKPHKVAGLPEFAACPLCGSGVDHDLNLEVFSPAAGVLLRVLQMYVSAHAENPLLLDRGHALAICAMHQNLRGVVVVHLPRRSGHPCNGVPSPGSYEPYAIGVLLRPPVRQRHPRRVSRPEARGQKQGFVPCRGKTTARRSYAGG